MTVNLLLVQILNGTQLGILLFLVAAGLTLVFGVMDFINLAHGVQYMLGAYLAASLGTWSGSFWIGLMLALPVALLIGLALELLVFRHLYDRDHLSQVLATFGVILTLQEAVRAIWGSAPLNVVQPEGLGGGIQIMPVVHGAAQLRARWGRDGARAILDTASVKVFLPGISDPETLELGSTLSDTMAALWCSFARTGRPEHPEVPAWPPYDTAERSTLVLDRVCRIEHDPRGDSAGLDVSNRLIDLVQRACLADHARFTGGVQFEHLA